GGGAGRGGRRARRGRAGAARRRLSARALPPVLPRGRGRVVAEEGGGRPMTEGGGGRRAAPTGAIPLLAAAILAIASLYFLVLSTRIVRARGPIEWVAPSTAASNSPIPHRPALPFLPFSSPIRPPLPPAASLPPIR